MPQYVRVPYKGKRDGTYVNGIQINQPCSETDQVFEICFDEKQVGRTEQRGTIGLRDANLYVHYYIIQYFKFKMRYI